MIAATTKLQGAHVTSTSSLLLRLAVIGLAGVGASSLAGCGRKSDPELESVAQARADRPVGIPVGPTVSAPKPEKKEKKPFLLDPLL
mgnify:CR=1 FL=1